MVSMKNKADTLRLFVKVNHKNELYFSIISFQNEAKRVYVHTLLRILIVILQ